MNPFQSHLTTVGYVSTVSVCIGDHIVPNAHMATMADIRPTQLLISPSENCYYHQQTWKQICFHLLFS